MLATTDIGTMGLAVELTPGILVPDGNLNNIRGWQGIQDCLSNGYLVVREIVDHISRAEDKDDSEAPTPHAISLVASTPEQMARNAEISTSAVTS
jgi:hypothetical protein